MSVFGFEMNECNTHIHNLARNYVYRDCIVFIDDYTNIIVTMTPATVNNNDNNDYDDDNGRLVFQIFNVMHTILYFQENHSIHRCMRMRTIECVKCAYKMVSHIYIKGICFLIIYWPMVLLLYRVYQFISDNTK